MVSDITPPVLAGLTISDTYIDIDNGETSFDVTLTVTDDDSGVADGGWLGVFVRFESPSGQIRDAGFYNGPTSGDSLNGTYTATLTFGPYVEAGTWTTSWVTLRDRAGNTASIGEHESPLLRATTLEVVNADDDTSPPTLEFMTLSRSVIDVGSGPASADVILHLKDDVSGVAAGGYLGASVRFESPSGSQFVDATYYYGPTSGTGRDGIYSTTISLGPFAESGVWTAEWVLLTDAAGNTASFDNAAALPHGASFTVTGTLSDTMPPVLKSLDVGAGRLKPDGSSEFVVSLHLTDDLSGLASWPYFPFGVRFVSSSGQIADSFASPPTSGSLDGTYEAIVSLNSYAESGVWRVQYVTARDAAGNTAWFTPEDTPFLAAAVIVAGSALPDTLDGTEGDDGMFGHDGDDTLRGIGGNDTITGGDGDDAVDSGAGDDTLDGGAGDDTLDGGEGTNDTAVFSGAWVNYTITGDATLTIVDTRNTSPDGTDTAANVEQFKFSNGTFATNLIKNDAPTDIALSGAHTVAEGAANNTVLGELTATDTDTALGDTATYSIVTPNGRFAISGNNLIVLDGSLLNFEDSTSHTVKVKVTDAKGLSYEEDIVLSITNVNEAPTAVAFTGTTSSLAENTSTATHIKVANIVVTDDALGGETLSLSGTDAASFEIVGSELFLKAGVALNFETKSSYAVTVNANDPTVGGNPDANQGFVLSITNVNDPPTAVAFTGTTSSLAENTSTATHIKVANIVVTDDALGSETLSLSGTDAASFEIVGSELFLKAGVALNFETKSSYAVTVNANDPTVGGNPDASKGLVLSITNVNEAPTIAFTGTTTSLAENTSTAAHIKVANIVVTDDALGSETLSLSGTDAASFEIVGSELFLKAGVALNFETKSSYAVTVNVNDPSVGGNPDASKSFTVSLSDANDVTPVFSSGTAATVSENTANSVVVYDANATDGDGTPANNTITYSLTGADAGRFSINSATGEVRFVASPDFETPTDAGSDNKYDILIRASDGVNITNLGVAISVDDLAEGAPTDGPDAISGTVGVEAFNGRLGNDILTGKGGADLFFFDTKLNKKTNVDHIADFTVGVDKIELDRSIFKKLKPGELSAKAFTSGKVHKDDRILYDKQSGDLSYDADGKGGAKAIKFAVLDGSPDSLSATDFVVVA